MIKPELGTKRVCPSCAARFYDLQKRPIECPKCNFAFEPELLLKQRRTRLPEEKPAPKVEAEEELESADEEGAAETTEDEELEEEEELTEADEPTAETDLETDEEPAPEEPVEAEEFEEDLEAEEEEDNELLEEVEEDEDDVSGIIDTDIEKDEP